MDSSDKPGPSAIAVSMTEREEQYFKPLLNDLLGRDTTRDFRHGWAKDSGRFAVLWMGRDEALKLLDRFDDVWPNPGDSEFIDDMRRRFRAQLAGAPAIGGHEAAPDHQDGPASPSGEGPIAVLDDPGWPWASVPARRPPEVAGHFEEAMRWFDTLLRPRISRTGLYPHTWAYAGDYSDLASDTRGRMISLSDTLAAAMAVNKISPPAIVEVRQYLHDTVVGGETVMVARRIAPRHTDAVPALCVMTAVWEELGLPSLRAYGEHISGMYTDDVVRLVWAAEVQARRFVVEGRYR